MGINTPPTALELQNAGTDLNTVDQFANAAADVNGTGIISTRRGGPIRVMAWFAEQFEAMRLDLAARLAGITAREADIDLITEALDPGQPLDVIADNLPSLIAASGIYPVALGEHDALEDEVITDPRVTVMHEDERYRPRVLPHTVALPFDPDDWYLMTSEGAAPAFVLAELRRLATYHPPVGPTFGVDRAYAFEAGSSGTIVNLASLVTDPDSPPESLLFEALGALPTGVTLAGGLLSRAAPPIQAPAAIVFRVTDEGGLSDTVTLTLHAFDPVSPPTVPPVWTAFPVWNIPQGGGAGTLNARSALIAGTTPLHLVAVSATGVPPGLTVTDGVLTGVPSTPGNYVITWTAADAFGAVVQTTQAINVIAAAAPVWSSIPVVTMTLGQTLPPVRYDNYLTSAPFPLSTVAFTVSGQPAGVAITARELRGVPAAAGDYTVTVTASNPAGVTAQIIHTIRVLAVTSGGSGPAPGGDGIRLEPF